MRSPPFMGCKAVQPERMRLRYPFVAHAVSFDRFFISIDSNIFGIS